MFKILRIKALLDTTYLKNFARKFIYEEGSYATLYKNIIFLPLILLFFTCSVVNVSVY